MNWIDVVQKKENNMSKILCLFSILICFLFSASPAFSKAFDTGGISEKSTEFGADEITIQGNKINHFIFFTYCME